MIAAIRTHSGPQLSSVQPPKEKPTPASAPKSSLAMQADQLKKEYQSDSLGKKILKFAGTSGAGLVGGAAGGAVVAGTLVGVTHKSFTHVPLAAAVGGMLGAGAGAVTGIAVSSLGLATGKNNMLISAAVGGVSSAAYSLIRGHDLSATLFMGAAGAAAGAASSYATQKLYD